MLFALCSHLSPQSSAALLELYLKILHYNDDEDFQKDFQLSECAKTLGDVVPAKTRRASRTTLKIFSKYVVSPMYNNIFYRTEPHMRSVEIISAADEHSLSWRT